MIIKIDTTIKDFDGKVVKYDENRDLTIALVLANVMASSQTDPLRAYLLGKKLAESEKTIDIDKLDYTFLKEGLTSSKMYFALVKGQVLEILQNAYEVEENKKDKEKGKK